MALIKVTKAASIPPGTHQGIITGVEQKDVVFEPRKGPEPAIEIVIQPRWKSPVDKDAETVPVRVSFNPVLNGLSALSALLKRLDMEPAGDSFDPIDLISVEVTFEAETKGNFVNVKKDSIRLTSAPAAKK